MSQFTPSRTPSPGSPGIYTPGTDEEQASLLSETEAAMTEASMDDVDEKAGLLPASDTKHELSAYDSPPHHHPHPHHHRGPGAGRCTSSLRRRIFLFLSISFVALFIFIGFTGLRHHRHHHRLPCGPPRHGHSITKPGPGPGPGHEHGHGHGHGPHGRSKVISESFRPDDFAIPEAFNFYEESSSGRNLHGRIKVVTDYHSSLVNIQYKSRKPMSSDTIRFTKNETGVYMSTSHHHDRISAKITIFLPRRIQHLKMNTHSLPIRIKHNVNLNTLKVASTWGDLKSKAKVSERTDINIHTGGISGTFDLGQELILETFMGSIRALIHPLDLKHATPIANMVVKTFSGSIDLGLDCKDNKIPKRNYTSNVSTKTGKISGTFLYGGELKLLTTTGSIDAKLTPTTYQQNEVGMLVTATHHGSTNVVFTRMLDGKWVEAYHAAITGKIGVRYPGDWEGRITAQTKLGKVQVCGNGVEITKNEGGLVEAFKGNKQRGRIVAGSAMGEVLVRIG
jgi:DUF4097 and DUF4098 domain-containing protein YvlB